MHTCMIWYLASRANPYRFCKLASRVRIAVYYFASSVQIRTCANFCTGSLGTHPKPRNHTSCELRVFTLSNLYAHQECWHSCTHCFWLHRLPLYAAYMEFHSDSDCDGSLSGSDHCRNRGNWRHITDGQWEPGRFHEIMRRLLFLGNVTQNSKIHAILYTYREPKTSTNRDIRGRIENDETGKI